MKTIVVEIKTLNTIISNLLVFIKNNRIFVNLKFN